MPRRCKDFLKSYLQYTDASEAPIKFHFWTAVSVVAGVLRRRVWIDQKAFQWTPNFYIVLVAPPGTINKSTTIHTGMRLLRQIDGIHFGPDALTWQALTQEMSEATEHMMFQGDFWPMSCVTLSISELGTLLASDDKQMVDVLVDLWDGRLVPWRKSTKTQGEDLIENPWINLITATTPSWIADNLGATAMSGGFMSRCLFVFAEKKRKLVPYPSLEVVEGYEQLERDLVHDLKHIAQEVKGPYEMTPEAYEWGIEWYERHAAADHSHLVFNAKTSGYIDRKQTHIHKLAMVVAAMRRDMMIIEREDLEFAEKMVSELEGEMTKVFSEVQVQSSRGLSHAQEILKRVAYYKKIPKSELYAEVFVSLKVGMRDFEAVIQSAQEAGLLYTCKMGGKLYVLHNAKEV